MSSQTRLGAEKIGRRMSEENGLEVACNALEKILRVNCEQHGARHTWHVAAKQLIPSTLLTTVAK